MNVFDNSIIPSSYWNRYESFFFFFDNSKNISNVQPDLTNLTQPYKALRLKIIKYQKKYLITKIKNNSVTHPKSKNMPRKARALCSQWEKNVKKKYDTMYWLKNYFYVMNINLFLLRDLTSPTVCLEWKVLVMCYEYIRAF